MEDQPAVRRLRNAAPSGKLSNCLIIGDLRTRKSVKATLAYSQPAIAAAF